MVKKEVIQNDLQLEFFKAVRDAQMLLTYATQEGKEIPTETVKSIVSAKEYLNGAAIDSDKESAFWKSYREIAKVVDPVTVASLNDIKGDPEEDLEGKPKNWYKKFTLFLLGKRKWTPARRTVFFYRSSGLFFLFFMIAVQIYWVIGSSLVADSRQIPLRIDSLTYLISQLEDSIGDQAADNNQINFWEGQILELEDELNVRYGVLGNWNQTWRNIPFVFSKGNEEEPSEIRAQFKLSLIRGEFMVQGLQFYLLPLLYGLLGAYAFVLRRISQAIKNLVYTRESNINYGLRVHLGALAGLAIGWFSEPNELTSAFSFGALSPLALAFLAGYSVELLFTIMDRLIISKDQKPTT